MEKAEISKILKFYKNINPQSKLNENDPEIINLWFEMFEDYTYDQVKNAIIAFAKRKPFAPSLGEIISHISVYEIVRIEPNTVVIKFDDPGYGNFPFRFESKQEAAEYSKLFRKCNYDKEMISMYHRQFCKERNGNQLIMPELQELEERRKYEMKKQKERTNRNDQ